MSLETQIDELYQLPLDQFTAARNALAKSLKGADAQRVKRLGKPAVVAWAINQVYWRSRAVYDKLLERGDALRAAQLAALKGKDTDVRRAAESHRTAVSEAVRQAARLAEAAGSRPGAEPLARTLEALSIAPRHPEQPGRLTDLVQPAGFEALAGVTPAAAVGPRAVGKTTSEAAAASRSAAAAPAASVEPTRKQREAEKRRLAEARRQERDEAARRRQQAAARKRAEAEVARAERAEAAARLDLERADEKLRGAERAVAAARAALRETIRASG